MIMMKTLDEDNEIYLASYTERECRNILTERYGYILEYYRQYGEDYGGSQNEYNSETYCREIDAEQIVVRDGHFAGVAIIADYECYNGGSMNRLTEELLLVGEDRSVRSGFSFSNDDHDRWDYVDIRLIERPDGVYGENTR